MYVAAKRNDDNSWEPVAMFTNGIIAGEWLNSQAIRARTWMHLFDATGREIAPKAKPAAWMK